MTTGIGETLRDARQQRGISLEDAAAETRIRATHLAAIEREEFERLGGDVYVRGFIKSYAKALGVDPEPLLAEHRADADRRPSPAPEPPLSQEPVESTPRRGAGVVVAGLALLAIITLAVWGGDDGDQVEVGSDDPTEVADDEGSDDSEDDADDADEAEADDRDDGDDGDDGERDEDDADDAGRSENGGGDVDGLQVELEVTDREAWVRAIVDGDEVLEGLLQPGANETFDGDDEIRLRIGDPAAVELVVNGESIGSPGSPGQPVWVTVDSDGEVATG